MVDGAAASGCGSCDDGLTPSTRESEVEAERLVDDCVSHCQTRREEEQEEEEGTKEEERITVAMSNRFSICIDLVENTSIDVTFRSSLDVETIVDSASVEDGEEEETEEEGEADVTVRVTAQTATHKVAETAAMPLRQYD